MSGFGVFIQAIPAMVYQVQERIPVRTFQIGYLRLQPDDSVFQVLELCLADADGLLLGTDKTAVGRNCVVDPSTVILGEVGLGGEVRAISQIDKRIAEIEKMGFKKAVIPKANVKNLKGQSKLEVYGIKHSEEALEITLN